MIRSKLVPLIAVALVMGSNPLAAKTQSAAQKLSIAQSNRAVLPAKKASNIQGGSTVLAVLIAVAVGGIAYLVSKGSKSP